jgi:hypothetical protein
VIARSEYALVLDRAGDQRQAFDRNIAASRLGSRITTLAGTAHGFAGT